MPRNYSMRRRSALVAETRQRIVDAAVAVHREKGALMAKPAEIAARANVALPTYYKYFPSIGTLVTACTARGRELMPPPDAEIVAALPEGPAVRIPVAVQALFDFYEAREPWLYAGRTEERFIPELRPVMERLSVLRDAFIRAALVQAGADRLIVASVAALTDYWAWRTLRRELNLTQEEAISGVTEAIRRITGPTEPDRPRKVAPELQR